MITKIRLQNWKSFKDSSLYIDSLGILIGTNASGKSNVLDAFAFLRAVAEGKSLLDAIQTVRGGEDWIVRRGENGFCLSVDIEDNGSEYVVDLRVKREDATFSYGLCEIHLKDAGWNVVPEKFVDSVRNITWTVYGVQATLDFLPMIYAHLRNVFILDPMPSRAKELVYMLKELSHQRQVDVLCTTHNPVLLDELGNKMNPFVSYVTRDKHGDSHVNLLEEKENLAKLMASGSIGCMMINNRL